MSSLDADVLIIGAGPAGCAAAICLARAGSKVVLIDGHEFPREKVCGDGLIPDALSALDELGIAEEVLDASVRLDSVRIHVPDGSFFSFKGEIACLQRLELDSMLVKAAEEAGALFLSGRRAGGPVGERGRVEGAGVRRISDGVTEEIRAKITMLATGASPGPPAAFGVLRRREPSAIAMRTYIEVPQAFAESITHLCVAYDESIRPGYGWVFPGPGGVFNLGVGCFLDSRFGGAPRSLHSLWEAFVESFEPARAVVSAGRQVAPLKGAALRCNMTGAAFHRPGLIVLGEAAGLTYSYIGEGIGKALKSGIIAAEVTSAALRAEDGRCEAVGEEYERSFRDAYAERYRSYRAAQTWLASPFVCNLIAKRARNGSFVTRHLEAMLTESADGRDLFSVRGVLRALLG